MDALECIKTRRSVRSYQAKNISKECIIDIIDAARLAPTANNLQPWEFIVVVNPNKKKELANLTEYGSFITNAAACIAVFCKDTKYFLEDGCAATQNLLLAAWAYGISSCWVAGHKKEYADDVRRLLGVPAGYMLVSLIPLGYPAQKVAPHDKRLVEEVIHWDKF